MKKDILKLLYRSFDEELDPNDKDRLEKALTESHALREEKKRIIEMRSVISNSAKDSFKPFFEERVMKRILRDKSVILDIGNLLDSLIKVCRPLSIASVSIILIILGYSLITTGDLSLKSLFGIPDYTIENIAYAGQLF